MRWCVRFFSWIEFYLFDTWFQRESRVFLMKDCTFVDVYEGFEINEADYAKIDDETEMILK